MCLWADLMESGGGGFVGALLKTLRNGAWGSEGDIIIENH